MRKRSTQKDARYNIRVLDRAFSVLSLLSDGVSRNLGEVSDAINLNASTTFRILASLDYHGYIERDKNTGRYQLGLTCLELAQSFQASNSLSRLALSDLEKLRDDITETVHLAVLDQAEVVYLQKLPGLHAIGFLESRVGGRLPAYCTGLGKVLLAYQGSAQVKEILKRQGYEQDLPRFTPVTITSVDGLLAALAKIRERGFGFDWGEHEPDVRCVAAPLFGPLGQCVAAISVAGPASRMDPVHENEAVIRAVVKTAADISERLGYRADLQPDLIGARR
jgi:DNA-binding IclR family transcriptional regulator